MNEKPQGDITRPLDKIIMCPSCGDKYTKALYDWQYIYCNRCGTYFEKHTVTLIKHRRDPQSLPKHYWKIDGELKII